MKNHLKRISAGLLVLFMVLSLLVGIIPADIFAASYTYNTGTRHDYNTSLSDQAEAYYTGEYTWDKLSSLTGGNENCLDIDNPLFEALHDLMTDTMTNSVSYSSLPNYWKYTDASNGTSGTIWFYADNTGSGSMSREHVWPKSHASFKEHDGGADLHHLRPSISNVNSTRGSMIMGNVRHLSGYTTKNYIYYKNGICEVNDNIKGDVARIFLYVWCRWEEPNLFMNTPNPVIGPNDNANDGGKVIESLDTLLEWCKIDPVDTWEMSRNDQVQNIQGNRNVFIDYPEFAWLIFGQDVPTDLNTPSNNAADGITGNPSGDENTGNSSSGNTGSTTTTTPPATQPPATQVPVTEPPATQVPVTEPPATQAPVTEPPATQAPVTEPPATEPGTSEGTQTSTPATQSGQPAPLPMASVDPNDFIVKDNSSTGTIIVIVAVLAVALIAGGIVIYLFVIKPKKAAVPVETVVPEEASTEEAPIEEANDKNPDGSAENNE